MKFVLAFVVLALLVSMVIGAGVSATASSVVGVLR